MDIDFIKSTQDDMYTLQKWSQVPSVHKWIYIDDWIDYFKNVSKLPDYYLYSVYINDKLCAHIAAENIDDYIAVSIIVNPEIQGKGIGTKVLHTMIENSISLFGNINGYIAGIFQGNQASIRCFEKCGFVHTETMDDGEMNFIHQL